MGATARSAHAPNGSQVSPPAVQMFIRFVRKSASGMRLHVAAMLRAWRKSPKPGFAAFQFFGSRWSQSGSGVSYTRHPNVGSCSSPDITRLHRSYSR